MNHINRRQIIALNRPKGQPSQQKPENVDEEFNVQSNQARSHNLKNETDTEMKQEPKGKFNFGRNSIVDESIKELTSAIKLLSNKMNNYGEASH